MKITKNMDTEESRSFWREANIENTSLKLSDIKTLPRLGDAWWKAETELSICLLDRQEGGAG